MELKNKRPSILFVLAHPDDESYIMGGTIAKYSSENVKIILLCLSKGEGGKSVCDISESLAEVRAKELDKASSVLGIDKKYVFNFPDGKLSSVENGKIEERIVFVIRKEKPDLVVTFHESGVTGHQDHIHVSRETRKAFLSAKEHQEFSYHFSNGLNIHEAKKLYFWTMEKKFAAVLGTKYHGVEYDDISTVIDTKKFVEKRVSAIKCHATQYKTEHFERREKMRRMDKECYMRIFPPFPAGGEKETDLLAPITVINISNTP